MIGLSTLTRQIDGKLQPEHLEGLLRDRANHNRRVLTTISVLSLLAAAVLLTQHAMWPDAKAPVGSTLWLTYTSIYIAAIAVSSIVLILGVLAQRWTPVRTYRFSQFVALIFVLTFAALSLADSAIRSETGALVLGMVVVASTFRGSARYHLSIILLALTVFLAGHVLLWERLGASVALTVVIAAVFGIYVALTMEGRRIDTFLTQGELMQRNRVLAHLSATDPLTGVMNRRTMTDHLSVYFEKYRRYGARCSLIMADIDFFKAINDRHGHAAGDDVLVEIAKKLTSELRISDEIARYGGEEFAIMLPHTRLEVALKVAERIRRSVEGAELSSRRLHVTTSLGVAEIRSDDGESTEVLQRADTALYRAKEAGRNRVVAYRSPAAVSALESETPAS
ncbi:MAG: GGDEF domain-containing protein [Spirochaetota bacterium]